MLNPATLVFSAQKVKSFAFAIAGGVRSPSLLLRRVWRSVLKS